VKLKTLKKIEVFKSKHIEAISQKKQQTKTKIKKEIKFFKLILEK